MEKMHIAHAKASCAEDGRHQGQRVPLTCVFLQSAFFSPPLAPGTGAYPLPCLFMLAAAHCWAQIIGPLQEQGQGSLPGAELPSRGTGLPAALDPAQLDTG